MRLWIPCLLSLALAGCASDTTTSSSSSGSGSGGQATTGGGATSDGGSGGQGAAGGAGTGGLGGMGGATGGAGGQGGQGGGMATCTWQSNGNPCGPGMFCDAPGCGAGVCAPVTNVDDTTKDVVCGCDGIDYWNTATASNYGMSVSTSGACPQSTFCGGFGGIPCPNGYFCAMPVGDALQCNVSDPGGACWGMPPTCNTVGFGGQQRPCASPNGACLYECEAIKSGSTYWGPDGTCPQ